MALAYKCDRCRQFFSKRPIGIGLDDNRINIQKILYKDCNQCSPAFDLCEECAKSFVKWWNTADIE